MSKFILKNQDPENIIVWSNGSSFDISILQTALQKYNIKEPWYYRNIRDVRTVVSLFPVIKNEHIFKGTLHNAIDDCINQIEYLTKTLKFLQIKK